MIISKILYVILLIVLAVFYIMYIDNMSFFLLVFALALPAVFFFIMIYTRSHIDAEILSAKMSENKDADIDISVNVTNRSIFPVPNACIKLEIMNILDSIPSEMSATVPVQLLNSQSMSFHISSHYCGKLVIKLKYIKIYDYIKLFSVKKKFNEKTEIVILPQIYPIEIFTDHTFDENTRSELYSKFKAGDDCSEVFDIRNYSEGDKINKIHWKLSMKQDTLMVKKYSLPVNCSVLILFEFYTDFSAGYMQKLDTLIETLSSVSESIAESEAVHEISWYSTAKNAYISSEISASEDAASFLGMLLKANAYSDYHRAYASHIKSDADNMYSHVIYITSEITKEHFHHLMSNENVKRKTILYITENAENLPDFFDDVNDTVSIIPVQCGKINRCLYEMIV
jgi:uncharacterized protein (DUF58 family)